MTYTVFIKHCPSLVPERKIFLVEHLKNRCDGMDIRWIEDYDYDNMFVKWIERKLNPAFGPKLISNFVKTLEMCRIMVHENIQSAFMFDDDVLLHKDWREIFDSVGFTKDVKFVNLGTPIGIRITPNKGRCYQLNNNGGCEGSWCTIEFASELLKSVCFEDASDIIIHGLLYTMNHPILCVPVCYQTSILEKQTSLDHETRKHTSWVDTVRNFSTLNKFVYTQLLSEFEKFLELKKQKEEKIWELYGKRVDIKNMDYILGESPDFCNDVLTF